MNEIMRNLFELQSLEYEETIRPDGADRIAALRARIPESILGHYDRLGDRGKKGVAPLRHQICSGCHVSVPLGVVLELKRDNDVRICENCGRYLYLCEEAPEAPVKKPARTPRKQLAHAR